MVKKVFVGVLIAAAFGLLVFGAANRTLAKSLDNEPLALNESAQNGSGGNTGTNVSLCYDPNNGQAAADSFDVQLCLGLQ